MFKSKKFKKINTYSHFIWLILLISISVLVINYYDQNKKNQIKYLKNSLDNLYLHKSIKKITSELKPRYENINYITKSGDTYESIINGLKINQKEKKLFIKSVAKHKSLKILRTGQKIYFKIDKMGNSKILEFKIETGKKNEMIFLRNLNNFC